MKLLQGHRVEDPKYVMENELEPDYMTYITNQILKPVMQIFELAVDNPDELVEDILRKENNKKKGNKEITDFFKFSK